VHGNEWNKKQKGVRTYRGEQVRGTNALVGGSETSKVGHAGNKARQHKDNIQPQRRLAPPNNSTGYDWRALRKQLSTHLRWGGNYCNDLETPNMDADSDFAQAHQAWRINLLSNLTRWHSQRLLKSAPGVKQHNTTTITTTRTQRATSPPPSAPPNSCW